MLGWKILKKQNAFHLKKILSHFSLNSLKIFLTIFLNSWRNKISFFLSLLSNFSSDLSIGIQKLLKLLFHTSSSSFQKLFAIFLENWNFYYSIERFIRLLAHIATWFRFPFIRGSEKKLPLAIYAINRRSTQINSSSFL